MIIEIGAFCLILSLILSAAQVGLSVIGRVRRSVIFYGAGEGAAGAAFLMARTSSSPAADFAT